RRGYGTFIWKLLKGDRSGKRKQEIKKDTLYRRSRPFYKATTLLHRTVVMAAMRRTIHWWKILITHRGELTIWQGRVDDMVDLSSS
ncbi:MAG: hypothetical protein MH252_04975, partial [Thermosynechococcaceae cyanobacterium MS004]|nr:hypothetical protein [Thermosynechococcaceae cyanobacterium MS004]